MLEAGKVYVMKNNAPYVYTRGGTFQLILGHRKYSDYPDTVTTLHLFDYDVGHSVQTFHRIKKEHIGNEAPVNNLNTTERLRLIYNIIHAEKYGDIDLGGVL